MTATVTITRDGAQLLDSRCKHYPLPYSPKLERLLVGDFDPRIGPFEVLMTRSKARNLRRHFFGSRGLKNVPHDAGTKTFVLPCGWTMLLIYDKRSTDPNKAGLVIGLFIPPKTVARKQAAIPSQANDEAREPAVQ